jgi:hypothetical protein
MQRLRDSKLPSGSPEAELANALAAMEPIVPSPSRQQRILRAVTVRARERRWGGAALLRPTVAGALLLLAGAGVAGATVGRGWLARGWQELTQQPVAVTPSIEPPPRRSPAAPVVSVARPEAIASAAAPEAAPPAPRPPRVARTRPARAEDPTALVEAVRALRSEHDPQRAARLLDAYLRAYPHGALAEEALALQIEAAANLKSPRAAVFARQYLRAYPNGRFRQAAQQAQTAAP